MSELSYFLKVDGGPSTASSEYPTLVKEFEITEGLSQLYDIHVVCEQEGGDVPIADLMRKDAVFTIVGDSGEERHFHGVIVAAQELEEIDERVPYRFHIAPLMWVMQKTRGSRIFQDKTVIEVLKIMFAEHGIHGPNRLKVLPLSLDYPRLDFCVQYEESAYDFVCRLMEEAGIFFWFEHKNDKHILVLGDKNQDFGCDNPPNYPYEPPSSDTAVGPHIFRFSPRQRIQSGRVALLDHSYKPLEVQSNRFGGLADSDLETYEQLGGYLEVTDDNRASADSAWADLAEIRHEENQVMRSVVGGQSTVYMMAPGGRFEVDFYPEYVNNDIDEDAKYVILQVKHVGARVDAGASGNADLPQYRNTYRVLNSEVPYRPPRNTPVPRVAGVQTAIVTGPDGQMEAPSGGPEIEVDELGRVKVQFHWDRRGLSGFPAVENPTSCWMRVGQAWAGAGFGQVFIPRIGMEVIVQFIGGNPDRPLITGCVYNGSTPLPLSLPSEKAHTVLRTESTPDGGGFNELRFQDEKDEERIYIHAQKDMDEDILNNHSQTVHAARTRYVGDKESVTVKKDQTITVEEGNRDITVSEGNLSTTVTVGTNTRTVKADESITIQSGNQSITVQDGSQTMTIKKGQTVNIEEGGQSTTVTAGGQTTTVTDGGQTTTITAGDRTVNVNGGAQIMNVTDGDHTMTVKGVVKIQTDAGGFITIDGKTITIDGQDINVNAAGTVAVQGKKIELNC